MFNVLDYGASPLNSPAENGRAIQDAVLAAKEAGGGTVLIPAGRFVSSNVELFSDITLRLESGARLVASRDWRDYAPSQEPSSCVPDMAGIGNGQDKDGIRLIRKRYTFLWAFRADNVRIEGPGVIDGQGARHEAFPNPADPERRRPCLVSFYRCTNVRVTDVRLVDPAVYALFCVLCRRVWVRGVSVDSWETENGDGLDFDGCENVILSDCLVRSGDDAIGLKCDYPDYPCRNITISNCFISTIWAGLRIGPESAAGYRNILLTGCVFENCGDAIKIQDTSRGVFENIRISDCVLRDVHRPLFVTESSYRLSGNDVSVRPPLGGIKGLVVSDLTVEQSRGGEDYYRNCCVISGTPGHEIRDVTLRNISFLFDGGGSEEEACRADVPEYMDYSFIYADVFSVNGRYPAAGLYLRHVKGLRVENCAFRLASPDRRSMLWMADTECVLKDCLFGEGAGGDVKAVESRVETVGCAPAIDALDARELTRYEENKAAAADTDAKFTRWASLVDESEKMKVQALIAPEAFRAENGCLTAVFTAPEAKILRFTLFGNAEIFLNGVSVGSCRIHPLYANRVKYACPIAAALREGENELTVRFDDPDQVGGIDTLLPFGEFRPMRAGLQTPAILLG